MLTGNHFLLCRPLARDGPALLAKEYNVNMRINTLMNVVLLFCSLQSDR